MHLPSLNASSNPKKGKRGPPEATLKRVVLNFRMKFLFLGFLRKEFADLSIFFNDKNRGHVELFSFETTLRAFEVLFSYFSWVISSGYYLPTCST